MSGTNPSSEPPPLPRRKRPWPARVARGLLWALLASVVSLTAAWIFREQLLVPLLRPRIERALAAALGAERVSIATLGGDWLTRLDATGIDVGGAKPPLRELRGARVEARYSLAALVRGDLAGLRAVSVSAASAQLDVRESATTQSRPATAAAPLDLAAWEPFLRLLPGGASVRIHDLHLVAAKGERRAKLEVDLPAGAADRGFSAAWSGVNVVGLVHARVPDGAGPRLDAVVDADDPGSLLDLFGAGAAVRGGKLHAEVGATLEPPVIEARIELRDLLHGSERLSESHVVARLDGARLSIDSAMLDVPGVGIELRDVSLPSPLGPGAIALRDLAGSFVVRVDDLSPHAALLPAELRGLLPVRATLAGAAAGGSLRLDASEVHARGVDLAIEQGAFALDGGDWRAAAGSLRFALVLDGFAPPLAPAAEAAITGRIAGTVSGSMVAPKIEARVDLGACRHASGTLASATGLVRAAPDAIAVEGLRVRGLRVPALGTDAPTDLGLDASLRLVGGAIDPDSAFVRLDAESHVPGELLRPVFAAQGLGPPPDGPLALWLAARQETTGIEIETLGVRTARGSPIELGIDGRGTLPLHWSPSAGLVALDSGTLALEARATRPSARAGAAPLAFSGGLHIGARSVELRALELQAGELALRGEAAADCGIGALLAPASAFADCPLRATLDLTELDLARLPPSWTPGCRLGGRLGGRVRVAGTARSLEPEVALELTGGSLRGEGLPALADARVRLAATARDLATQGAITAAVSAAASLEQELGLDRKVALEVKLRCDEAGTVLEPATLSVGGGDLAVQLRSSLRRSEVLAGALDAAKTTLSGSVVLRELVIDRLPAALLASVLPRGGQVRGKATGEVVLDGTLGSLPAAVKSARLSLRDGELKSSDLPRVEHLAAELECGPNELALRSLSGVLGAGRFTVSGSLRQDGQPLWESIDAAKLDLRLDGEDVLLFRGDGAKARATLHVTASGTPRECKIGGEVVFGRGSKYVRRISLVPDLSSRGGESASEGFRLFQLPAAIGDRILLELAIKTKEPFEVRTAVFDCECDVAAHLRGTGTEPRLEGTISMRDGILRFPGANLRLTSGLVTFTRRDPEYPDLLLHAAGKRVGIQVAMTISGRYDKPQVQLSSIPPLPPQDLIVLLSTGQLPSTIGERGTMAQARFVGGFLAMDLLESWFGSESTERGGSFFDRFTVETGKEISKNGTESVLVEFELTKSLAVQAERDVYEDYNMGVLLRFKFR